MKPIDKKLEKIVNKETYRMIKDGATIDIGGLDHDDVFYPSVTSKKWGGECWLKITHRDKETVKAAKKAEKGKGAKEVLKNGKLEVEVDVDGTGRKHRMREGSLEWEIEYTTIDDLPGDDIEVFNLEFPYDQLSWHHQSELSQKEIDAGASRPDNVINSYAGYFNKANNEYETGKFCHIYRSKMIANDGEELWLTQELIHNELKISIPRDWCIAHGFPVILDPDVGYTTVGGSSFTAGNNMRGNWKDSSGAYFSVGANADKLDKMFVYTINAGQSIECGVYDHDVSNNPDNLIQSDTATALAADWTEVDMGQTVSLTGSANYSMAFAHGAAPGTKFDAVTNAAILFGAVSTLSDPFAESTFDDFLYSLYFSYTESTGSTLLPINENGYGADSVSVIVSAAVSDIGAGADNFGGMDASVPVVDSGSGSDSINPLVSLLISDTASAVDAVSQILNSLSIPDTGSAIDSIAQIIAALAVTDSGTGSDGVSLLSDIFKMVTDTGSGSDDIGSPVVSLSVSDAGVATDLVAAIATILSIQDSAAASDLINTIKTQLVQVQDSGLGSDSVSMNVSLTVADTAAAADAIGQILNALAVSDAGSGFDTAIKTDFDILPSGKVTITFSMKVPGLNFEMKKPGVDFSMKKPGVDFTIN